MGLSNLASRLPGIQKTVWVSRLSSAAGELAFALIGSPKQETDCFGGSTYELVSDMGSGKLWLSALPGSPPWPNGMTGQACVIHGESPPGWTLFQGPVLRSVDELEAMAASHPMP